MAKQSICLEIGTFCVSIACSSHLQESPVWKNAVLGDLDILTSLGIFPIFYPETIIHNKDTASRIEMSFVEWFWSAWFLCSSLFPPNFVFQKPGDEEKADPILQKKEPCKKTTGKSTMIF